MEFKFIFKTLKMKYFCLILLAWLNVNQTGPGLYVCKNAMITLFSSAPIEDIKGVSQTGVSVFNAANGELDFSVNIRSFKFDKAVMQEHFNSDYMESDKYPKAIFKGKMQETVDLTKDGNYPVTVTGDLTLHNITQKRTIKGKIDIKGGVVTMTSEFMVKNADYHIDIPTILFHHIAESIQISVSAAYIPYKNNPPK